MTTLTDTQVITASGGLVELGYSASVTDQTVAAGANSVLIGPLTVVCDGSPIIVDAFWPRIDSPTNGETYVVVELDGASQNRIISSNSPTSLSFAAEHHGQIRLTPSAGSHTIQLRAYAGTNTATYRAASASGMAPAFLRVSKIVQATQWPAVTTGTIICTSTTRPGSPFEGQTIYETDTDLSLTWSGSAWVQTGSIGAWTTFVPTLTQSGTVTKTDSYCKWTRFGRTIHATTFVNATGAGTAGSPVTLSLPVAAAAGAGPRIGSCHIYDASTGTRYTGMAEVRTGSASVGFVGDWSSVDGWGAIPNIALASTDQVAYSVTYEAAS